MADPRLKAASEELGDVVSATSMKKLVTEERAGVFRLTVGKRLDEYFVSAVRDTSSEVIREAVKMSRRIEEAGGSMSLEFDDDAAVAIVGNGIDIYTDGTCSGVTLESLKNLGFEES